MISVGSGQGAGDGGPNDVLNMPERVHLVLGRDDLFPYRLDYSDIADSIATGGRATGNPSALRIEWYDVQLDGPVDARRFRYSPTIPNWTDVTDNLVESAEGLRDLVPP